jgi:hypothetical protein
VILKESEIRVVLGLEDTITDHERSVLVLAAKSIDAAIIARLGYDPVQRSRTEYYPRYLRHGSGGGFWDVNVAHTHAVHIERNGPQTIQLKHLPIRKITSVRVDSNGYFGKGASAFPASTAWTEGEDFFAEYEQGNYAPSGIVQARGAWTVTPGSIKITYLAGYSEAELAGEALANVDSGGIVTTAYVNASDIKQAAILTAMKFFKTVEEHKKQSTVGFTAGAINSEKLGDYSYTLDTSSVSSALSSMQVSLPQEADMLLEPYMHYGDLVL